MAGAQWIGGFAIQGFDLLGQLEKGGREALHAAAEKISDMGLNILFVHGDVVNFFKFGSFAAGRSILAVPFFELFNGVSSFLAGVHMAAEGMLGLSQDPLVEKPADGCKAAAGMALLAAALAKAVGAVLTMVVKTQHVFREAGLPLLQLIGPKVSGALCSLVETIRGNSAALSSLSQQLGRVNSVCSVVMFSFYVLRALYNGGCHLYFIDAFRQALLEKLPEDKKGQLPRFGTPKSLFDAAADLVQRTPGYAVEPFARGVLESLREKLGKEAFDAATEKGMFEYTEKPPEPLPVAALYKMSDAWFWANMRNISLGAVSLAAIVGVVLLMTVAVGSPAMTVLFGGFVLLCVVFVIGFDGKGIVDKWKEKPKEWDLPIICASAALAVGLTAASAALSIASGGTLPLIFSLVVGGCLLLTQTVALTWVVYHKIEE